ncbi:MAG: hypothetical protein LBH93_00640 [Chitinispirillales bacterium]|jgi:hypothetical protein|nr:hypothetical protein [Chitinispirillales bacterium]
MIAWKEARNIEKRYLPAVVAAALLTLMTIPLNASVLATPLPSDESGLSALLEERAIDTLQYEQLLVYYALPLSVPQGELALLAQIFPDIAEMIPAAPEELEGYQPFDNRQVRRLFNDYPALADVEPILRFNASPSPQPVNGEVVVGINKSSVEALNGHRVRFRHKNKYVSTEGGAAFSDSGAVWQSRRADLLMGRVAWDSGRARWDAGHKDGIRLHIGNFKQPMPGELMFGRFSPLASLTELTNGGMSDVTANWLYGGSNAWNGVSVDMGEAHRVSMARASAFYHARPAEVGFGGGVDVRVGRQVKVFLGLTGFALGAAGNNINAAGGINDAGGFGDIDDDSGMGGDGGVNNQDSVINESYRTAHLHGEYKAKAWRIASEAALPLGRESVIPALSLRINYRIKESSAEYRVIAYPSDFAAPMSRSKKQLLAEIGVKEQRGALYQSSIQKHALRMAVPLMDNNGDNSVKLIPEIDFTESGGSVRRIYALAEARARANIVDIAVKQSSKIFTAASDSVLHTSSASINVRMNYPIEIRASVQSAYGYYKNARNTYSLELPCTALPGAVIAPYINGKYVLANEYRLGIKSEFHLSQKTWTGVTLEIPINIKGDDNVYIKGSSSYAF